MDATNSMSNMHFMGSYGATSETSFSFAFAPTKALRALAKYGRNVLIAKRSPFTWK